MILPQSSPDQAAQRSSRKLKRAANQLTAITSEAKTGSTPEIHWMAGK